MIIEHTTDEYTILIKGLQVGGKKKKQKKGKGRRHTDNFIVSFICLIKRGTVEERIKTVANTIDAHLFIAKKSTQ